MRAGHQGFMTGILPEVDKCLQNFSAPKPELLRWKGTLKKQVDKILPLDEEMFAHLVTDETASEEDITTEIERRARLKADLTQ